MNNKKIEFNSTRLQALRHKKELLSVISQVIDSGIFLKGKVSENFTQTLKNFYKVKYVITVKSGHDALILALQSLQLPNNTEVLVQANAYPTAFPIVMAGLKLRLVDCDKNGQLDVADLQQKITAKTKVLIIVHMYGLVGNIKKILSIAKKNKLIVMEDCAQAFGSQYSKKRVGTFSTVSCLSFYPTKNIGALGDGGAIITNNKKIYQYLQLAKNYGQTKDYKSYMIAGHSRLPEMQAAVLLTYYKYAKKDFDKKITLFNYYLKQINKYKLLSYIEPLVSGINSQPVVHLFVIKAKKRDLLLQYLKTKKIPCSIHYPYPIHLVPAFRFLKHKKGDFPQSELLAKSIISLPFHSYMTYHQIDIIINHIRDFYE